MSSTVIASVAANGEKSPSKKTPETEPTLNPSLPDDLVVTCLARIPRLHYPTLSLVSKSLRSLLSSPELYQTRSLLNRTDICLYVCLRFPSETIPRWYTLSRKPDKFLNNHISKKNKNAPSGNLLVPISFLNSPPAECSNLIAVGHNLYAPIENAPCANVSFLDCRTHTWLEAPSLRFAHTGTKCDGDMYFAGCYENPDSLNCIEVFNTNTKTWKPVPPEKRIFTCGKFQGKMYISLKGRVAYYPKEATWEIVRLDTDSGQLGVCCIKDISYFYYKGVFMWADPKVGGGPRGKLEGLEGLPKFPYHSTVKLVDYGGKMLVLWDKHVPASWFKKKMIWCAVISLERRSNENIWGKVEWFDAVLTVPRSYKFVFAVAATV
ncbi:unnamed protein product [Microthlaspi erraticum]|uniref:F-box domain-containing protein n=1 Tax=Microthlaspi erraticum TaxID=1685480 RepID=A0A6D2HYR6_9BRAS|nr:unnamed protein product [Microthlaspi erraticum]